MKRVTPVGIDVRLAFLGALNSALLPIILPTQFRVGRGMRL